MTINTQAIESQNFDVYACLPFVELANEASIQIGPIIFWPCSKSEEFLTRELQISFHAYLDKIRLIRTKSNGEKGTFVNTGSLSLKEMTCISVAKDIPKNLREFLLIDSLYLLYFACTFRDLYYGQKIVPFNPLRKLIPATEEFLMEKRTWEEANIYESDREETVRLLTIDSEICHALGKALNGIYLPLTHQVSPELIQSYKRLVRSVRYLVDRFFLRFVNLFKEGLNFSEEIFEPEDVIFLASSFETLFNIDDSQNTASDFKHKLRPLLHLKYSQPVETFWKWVDDFYHVKRRILDGETFLNPSFCLNPNFEVSHIQLGIKLFVYSVYYFLFKYKLIQSTYEDSYTPPDFKWIHPEEVLLFFWSEESVLEKISFFLKQAEKGTLKDEMIADLNLLTFLFVSLYDRYYLSDYVNKGGVEGIQFLASPLSSLVREGNSILEALRRMNSVDPKPAILQVIHPYFYDVLQDRLQEKKMKRT